MSLPHSSSLLGHARDLRRNMTKQERRLWYEFLRDYPVKIYKQKIIGSYIADFYCERAKLIIELDGSQHYEPEKIAYDARRTAYFAQLGLLVIRFSNADVQRDFPAVCDAIHARIQQRMAEEAKGSHKASP